MIEGSLSTRVMCYINTTIVFLKNCLLGVGWGHLGLDLIAQFKVSPVPLTMEIIKSMTRSTDKTTYGLVIGYRIMAETGIIGTILFYLFPIVLFKKVKTIANQTCGDLNLLFSIYKEYLIFFIIFSFYESLLYAPFYWILFGLITASIYKYRKHSKKGILNASINNFN